MIRLLALGALGLAGSVQAQDPVAITLRGDSARWLRADATVELELSRTLDPGEGRLAIVVGSSDLTPLFRQAGTRLTYSGGMLPLPAGETEIAVYLVAADRSWRELSRLPLRVLSNGGFQQADVLPSLAITNKGQVAEGRRPEPPAPGRESYQEVALTSGLQTTHVRDRWSIRTRTNVMGVTDRHEALRFADRGNTAPKLDLSDYLISIDRGAARLSLGHVSYGSNRHLVNGFASRGVSAGVAIGPAANLSVAALNGSSVVGWSNLLGVSHGNHRVISGSLALELVPGRPGLLAVQATALDGSVLPRTGFTQGGVIDAEDSQGLGVRINAADPTGRIRVEAGLARSRFHNPDDPELAQGSALVPVRQVTRSARYLDVGLAIIRGTLGGSTPVNLTATWRHERVDPLFRSVAAVTRADFAEDVLGITGSVGPVALEASHSRAHDNLDRLSSVLTTRTRMTGVSAAMPLGAVLGSATPLVPLVTYAMVRVHQAGDGVPANSEFNASHVPDQVSINHGVGVQWQGSRWRLGYQLNSTDQDNRQTGRELSDFGNLTNTVSFGVTPAAMLDLSLDLGFEGAENYELSQEQQTRRIAAAVDWRLLRHTTLGAGYATTTVEDDQFNSRQTLRDLRVELSQRIRLFRLSHQGMAGQLFVRYARQSQAMRPMGQAGPSDRIWTISTGFNLTAF